jgi:hypothetical protein
VRQLIRKAGGCVGECAGARHIDDAKTQRLCGSRQAGQIQREPEPAVGRDPGKLQRGTDLVGDEFAAALVARHPAGRQLGDQLCLTSCRERSKPLGSDDRVDQRGVTHGAGDEVSQRPRKSVGSLPPTTSNMCSILVEATDRFGAR